MFVNSVPISTLDCSSSPLIVWPSLPTPQPLLPVTSAPDAIVPLHSDPPSRCSPAWLGNVDSEMYPAVIELPSRPGS